MSERVTQSTLEVKANVAGLNQIYELLSKISSMAGTATSTVSGIGANLTAPGGGGSGPGGGVAPGSGGGRGRGNLADQFSRFVGNDRTAIGSGAWMRQLLAGGGDMGRLAGMGLAGHALISAIGGANQAAGTYFGAGVGQEAGLYSGSAFGAATAMSQAQAARTAAKYQAAGGVGGTVGGGLMAAGAMAGFTPVGWAMMGAGAIASVGSGVGAAAGAASAGKLSAREQAAIGQMEKSMSARLSLARMQLVGAYFGADVGEDIVRTANRFGVEASEAQSRFGQYRRGVGKRGAFGADEIMGAQFAGLEGGGMARWERGYMPGGGIKGGGSDRMQDLEQTLTQAMRAGMDEARFSEYLERAANYQQMAAEQGINIHSDALNRITSGLMAANPNLQGMSAMKAAEGMQRFSSGLMGSLTNAMAPQEMVQGMALQRLFGQGGGLKGAMKSLADPNAMEKIYSGMMQSAPDIMRPFMGSQLMELDPNAAAGLANWKPGMGGLPSDINLRGRAEEATSGERGKILSLSAEAQNASALAYTIRELGPALNELLHFVRKAAESSKALAPGGIRKASEVIDGGSSTPTWGAGATATTRFVPMAQAKSM